MTQREKLIELLIDSSCCPKETDCEDCEYRENAACREEMIADYLLANGVVILPCKVGDTVYYLSGISGKLIKSAEVEEITISDSSWCVFVCSDMYNHFVLQEDEVYFTHEEAEAALKKMEGCK